MKSCFIAFKITDNPAGMKNFYFAKGSYKIFHYKVILVLLRSSQNIFVRFI